jgi:diguanylate cyclase (GGDEF)-like protein
VLLAHLLYKQGCYHGMNTHSSSHYSHYKPSKGSMQGGLPGNGYRRSVLQLLLLMTAMCSVIFSLLNWPKEQSLASFELLLGGYCLLLLAFSRHEKNQFKLSFLYLVPLYTLFLYALTITREAETGFVWILVIPVLSHLLLGRWVGLWVSVSFMSLAFIIYIVHSLSEKNAVDILAISNLALAASAVLTFSHVYEVSRVRAHGKLLYLATTDNLTSLANRARFLDVFERERNHAVRNNADLSLLLLDLDHFKQVNDLHGHDVGDDVLKYVSASISHRLRITDLACRLGGEEFAVLLPGADLERAIIVAETIRKNISDLPYTKGDKIIPLSISIGASEYGYDGRDLESLYAIADGHLYKAKAGGRNKVCYRKNMRNCELDLALAD